MTRHLKGSLVFISLALLAISYFLSTQNLQRGDPDYFYHMALSRHMQTDPIPHVLPQIQGIGWSQDFTDKEFLFHQLSSKLFSLGGEKAVQYLPLFLLCLTLGILWIGLPPKIKAYQKGLILLGVLSSPYWSGRLVMVRPHTLAVPLVLALAVALNRKKKWASGVIAALFSLSYHALQVPLALMGLFAGVQWLKGTLRKGKAEKQTLLYGGVGLGLGLVANPYFPGVFFVGVQHLMIALKMTQGGDLPYGAELYPWMSSQLVIGNLIFIFILGLAIVFQQIRSFSFLVSLFFWGLSCLSPRAQEYAIPLTGILLGELFLIPVFKKRMTQVAFGGVFVFHCYGFISAWAERRVSHDRWDLNPHPYLQAAQALPHEEMSIFNCSWDSSPYLYYFRPKARFLDILDPSFLYLASRESYDLRTQLVNGLIGNPYGLLKDFFQVKYVYCQSPPLVAQMELDARFIRRFPEGTPEGSMFVYELREEPNPHFVNHYEVIAAPQGRQARVQSSPPLDGWQSEGHELFYLDLKKWYLASEKLDQSSAKESVCFWVRPETLDRFTGSTYVGVGGSPNVRVWMNQAPLYQNVGEFAFLRTVDTLIPLLHPLTKKDRLELLVCGKKGGEFLGASLSFWTESSIDETCEVKKNPYTLARMKKLRWGYLGSQQTTCLGPIAVRGK